MKNVFGLSNDATVRQNSIHTEKIEWKDHIKWFKQRISKKMRTAALYYDGI